MGLCLQSCIAKYMWKIMSISQPSNSPCPFHRSFESNTPPASRNRPNVRAQSFVPVPKRLGPSPQVFGM
jgi:hypothetical protein